MLESLKTIWQSHDQANQAQLPQDCYKILQGFYADEKKRWWENSLPSREEYWKYVKFDDLNCRSFVITEPGRQANKIEQTSSGHWKISINDFSQGARWEVPEGQDIIRPLHQVLSDSQTLKSWEPFFAKSWATNYFSAMNRSFLYSGLVINCEKNASLEIVLEGRLSGAEDSFNPFHLFLQSGEGSRVKIYESIDADDFSGFFLYDRLLNLESGSQVSVVTSETGSAKSVLLQNSYSHIAKDSHLDLFDMTLPSQWSRHNTTASLNETGANARLYGLYLNDQTTFCDHHTNIEHQAPYTTSKQIYKGVLADKAKAVFNGKVYIAHGARQSFSEQLNKNMLLSEKAEINTKPELQIYNDDVKATHGATIGQIDEEQLFYLVSRGLNKELAWQLLCQAFTKDLFDDFSDQNLVPYKNRISQTIETMQVPQ